MTSKFSNFAENTKTIGHGIKDAGSGIKDISEGIGHAAQDWKKGNAIEAEADGHADSSRIQAVGRANAEELAAKKAILEALPPADRLKYLEKNPDFLKPSSTASLGSAEDIEWAQLMKSTGELIGSESMVRQADEQLRNSWVDKVSRPPERANSWAESLIKPRTAADYIFSV